MAVSGALATGFLLVVRLLFGAILAFTGLDHFLDMDAMVPYAEVTGVRLPGGVVSGAPLVLGGVGIVLCAFPVLAAVDVLFFVVTTPAMHGFWAQEVEQAHRETTHFL